MTVLMMRIYLLSLITISYAAVFSPDFEKELDSYIKASMKCHHIPGMTLSVVKDGDVWSKGYGKEDIFADKDVDSDTKFNIGSVTKSFTATLVGMLLSEKGLNWTTKVTDILGSQYEFTDAYRTKELTLRDLLSHRTGLARLDSIMMSQFSKSISRGDLCRHMKYLPAKLPIRDGFLYNNFMYMMAGHVAEVLGHDTWENLVTKRILQPLGMNDTTIMKSSADVTAPNVARPYIYVNGKFLNGTYGLYDIYPVEPAGAIMSTALDMAKWAKFHLNLGKTESGTQLIDKRLVEDMHRITTAISYLPPSEPLTKPKYPADDIISGYGYAWFVSEYRGFRNVWHSGGLLSYRTLLWTFPDKNIGLFASVNGPNFGDFAYRHRMVSFYHISDHLLGLQPWLNESTACSFPEPWGNRTHPESDTLETPVSVPNLAEFEGTYESQLLTGLNVSSNSTDLILNAGLVSGVLHPSSENDRFLYEVTHPKEYALHENNTHEYTNITFHRDASTHAVTSLTFKLEVDVKFDKQSNPQIIG